MTNRLASGFAPAFALAIATSFATPLAGSRALGQSMSGNSDAVEVRHQIVDDLDSLNSKITQLANAFPADKYDWRPGPGVRSVGEVFMHLASEYYVYWPMSLGGAPSPSVNRDKGWQERFEKNASKDSVLKNLAAGHDYARSAIAGANFDPLATKRPFFGKQYTIVETSLGMVTDMHEHLGQLIAYARMNGITPPWSRKTS